MLDEERFRKPETKDDIIREMRDLGALDAQCNDMIPRSLQALGLRTYADRLAAAAERERIQRDKVSFRCGDCARFGGDCDAGDSDGNEDRVACEKFVRRAIVPGNAVALRAALESMSENLAMHVRCGRFVAPGDHVSFPISEAEAYIRDIRAALAAPPRNCDRFKDWKVAQETFKTENWQKAQHFLSIADAFKWMFATGGDHDVE